MNITRESLIADYLDYVNNYLSPITWGEHRGLSESEAVAMLKLLNTIWLAPHPES